MPQIARILKIKPRTVQETLILLDRYRTHVRNCYVNGPLLVFEVISVAAVQGVYSLGRISEPFRINIEYMWLLKKQPASDYMTMFGRFFYDS